MGGALITKKFGGFFDHPLFVIYIHLATFVYPPNARSFDALHGGSPAVNN